MAAYNKFDVFTQDLIQGAHLLQTHTFKVMLTNTLPLRTNTVKANITDITAQNGYTAGGTAVGTITISNASGVEKAVFTSVTFTAAGGPFGPFQYAVLYNDTQGTPAKPLVMWADYGSAVTLNAGETFTWTPDAANGLFTVT